MLGWGKVVGSVCNGYMCIVLYEKLIYPSGFPEIYAQLEEGIVSAYHWYMCILLCVKLIGVVVFQRSMLHWRSGPWYMCILLYVKLIQCCAIPYIYF